MLNENIALAAKRGQVDPPIPPDQLLEINRQSAELRLGEGNAEPRRPAEEDRFALFVQVDLSVVRGSAGKRLAPLAQIPRRADLLPSAAFEGEH